MKNLLPFLAIALFTMASCENKEALLKDEQITQLQDQIETMKRVTLLSILLPLLAKRRNPAYSGSRATRTRIPTGATDTTFRR